jgi:ADP-ribosylglycohydrolase
MNIGIMGMMFGGTIADVMGDAGEDIEEMLEDIVED